MKVIDAHNAREGYKKIAKMFSADTVSTVYNVIKRWQLWGAVEVMPRSGRLRKVSGRIAYKLVRKLSKPPKLYNISRKV